MSNCFEAYQLALKISIGIIAGLRNDEVENIMVVDKNQQSRFGTEFIVIYQAGSEYTVLGSVNAAEGETFLPDLNAIKNMAAKLKLLKATVPATQGPESDDGTGSFRGVNTTRLNSNSDKNPPPFGPKQG